MMTSVGFKNIEIKCTERQFIYHSEESIKSKYLLNFLSPSGYGSAALITFVLKIQSIFFYSYSMRHVD